MLHAFDLGFGLGNGDGDEAFVNEKYILLDGVDESVDMGDVLGFDGDEAFSAFAWIRPTTFGHTILAKRDQSGTQPGWSMEHVTANKLDVEIRNATGNRIRRVQTVGDAGIQDGLWHHVGFTYDGSQDVSGINIYYDGSLVASVAMNNNLSLSIANAGIFCVGARDSSARYFEGGIDEPTVYSKELSGAEVAALYNGGLAITPKSLPSAANLEAWYRCGDGDTYPVLTDKSGNARNGTIINMLSEFMGRGVP